MFNLERNTNLHVAIAGQTSTAKTQTAELTTRILREEHHMQACCLSIGDIFRFLTYYIEPSDNIDQMTQHAKDALHFTHVKIDETSGKISLINGEKAFVQNMENGHNAGKLGTIPSIVHNVNEFIYKRITGPQAYNEITIFDGRERGNARLLFVPQATANVRLEIYKSEYPDASKRLSDDQIRTIIAERDIHEKPLIDALQKFDINMVYFRRTNSTHEETERLAHQISGIIFDFNSHKMGDNFGAICLP